MRALLFNTRPSWRIEPGGDSVQLEQTANELVRLGVDVEVCETVPLTVREFDVVHLFNIQTAGGGRLLAERAIAERVPMALSTIYWDMRLATQAVDVLRFSSHSGVRFVAGRYPRVAVAAAEFKDWLSRQRHDSNMAQFLVKTASVLLPNSFAELEILVQRFADRSLRGRAVAVPNGVQPDLIESALGNHQQGFPDAHDGVVEIGLICPNKGQLALLTALADRPEIPLTFVGRDGNSRYAALCHEAGLRRGNTQFTGQLTQLDALLTCRTARVHVLPSLRESPGLSSLEAGALGLNCVVGDACPVSEYFGTDAFVCDPLDWRSVKRAVLEAYETPRSGRLRERILRTSTWARAAEATFDGYKFAVAHNRSQA